MIERGSQCALTVFRVGMHSCGMACYLETHDIGWFNRIGIEGPSYGPEALGESGSHK
jgi:hypothetical protein